MVVMKQIFMFFELHVSLLKFLAGHTKIESIDHNQQIKVSTIESDQDYINVFIGKLKVTLLDKYSFGSLKPGGARKNCEKRYVYIPQGESINPNNLKNLYE